MNTTRRSFTRMGVATLGLGVGVPTTSRAATGPDKILNVSYDIARELFAAINPAFIALWAAQTGQRLQIDQSHGGSSRQARAILEGLEADVVTFNQVLDVQILHDRGQLVSADWQNRLPNRSSPYYSLPAFLVRAGNPKGIKDWGDLARPGVGLVLPNPKTSGNARYTYLAVLAFGLEAGQGNEAAAQDLVRRVLANVAVFDTGGRAATTTFVEREIGDVLLTFEAETQAIKREFGDRGFEIVVPPMSLLAEFPVTVVDSVVDRRGSREVATAYLRFLYSPEGQEIIARFGNRVHEPTVAARHAAAFPPVRLVTVEERLGGWAKVNEVHFRSDGVLDQLLPRR